MRQRGHGWGLAAEAGTRDRAPGTACGMRERAGNPCPRGSTELGFTLVELLVGMMLLVMLLALGAFALRQYWLTHALRGGRDQVVTQLRQLQQRSVSESHPLVYGARFRVGSPTFGLVKFNPHDTAVTGDDTCVEMTSVTLGSNVQVNAVDFADATGITSLCRTQLPGAASDEFVFFYARGTATSGNLTLQAPALPEKSLSLSVTPITGRVNPL